MLFAINLLPNATARPKRLVGGLCSVRPIQMTLPTFSGLSTKQAGKPIPENDVWITALAKQFFLEIVSRDPHFDFVIGIHRLSW